MPEPASAPANPSGTTTPASSVPALHLLEELLDRRRGCRTSNRVGSASKQRRRALPPPRRRTAPRRRDGPARPAELEPERHDDDRRQDEHEEQVGPVADLAEEVDAGDRRAPCAGWIIGRHQASRRAASRGRPVTRPISEQHRDRGQAVGGGRRAVPCMSPRPRRNQPCGVSSASRRHQVRRLARRRERPAEDAERDRDGAVGRGRRLGRVDERGHERRDPDRRQRSPRRPSAATPSGGPQSASISSVVATTSTVIATTAHEERGQRLAGEDESAADTGPARIRAERPERRSSNRLTMPDLRREEQEQDRHRRREVGRQAELADRRLLVDERGRWRGGRGLRGDARLLGRRRAGAASVCDRLDRRAGPRPRRRRTAAPTDRAISVARPSSRAPTTRSVTGSPARIDVAEPGRDDERDVVRAVLDGGQAAASVGASWTTATPPRSSAPMTSTAQDVREVAAVEVDDDPGGG